MAGAQAFVAIAVAYIVIIMSLGSLRSAEGWKGEEPKFIHVGGKVMCQDCTQGSKVAVTCMDARKRVVYHVSDDTDEQGDFDVLVSKYVNGKEVNPERCAVRLVSSPDQACNVMTDFGNGRSGVKLYRPSHVYPGMVKYTVGPFFFTSPMCDEPETTAEHAEWRWILMWLVAIDVYGVLFCFEIDFRLLLSFFGG
ncbi:uncharacterized protein LOC109835887 isoform X2 [Asparagus officinalis]|uniref:uncharacterized protein LOC109835887 isoform X2 n=1 Tax=Asparagus officinalis TaxID=4686 RepID=UPI00098E12C6|nr:uncharacterized protein LOC109835887 isoform X2 [Asparagus officinalis]